MGNTDTESGAALYIRGHGPAPNLMEENSIETPGKTTKRYYWQFFWFFHCKVLFQQIPSSLPNIRTIVSCGIYGHTHRGIILHIFSLYSSFLWLDEKGYSLQENSCSPMSCGALQASRVCKIQTLIPTHTVIWLFLGGDALGR